MQSLAVVGRPFLPRTNLLQRQQVSRPLGGRQLTVIAALPVVSGIPILGPVANFVCSPPIVMASYCIGAARLWQGFSRTTYSNTMATKLGLILLWPVLFAASKNFRENFKKAAL